MRACLNRLTAIAVSLGALFFPVHSGAEPGRSGRDALPRQSDWFLSTGDWHKDSQLYVREFGDGHETVVVLHGGWGAEHSGLVDAVRDLEHEYHFVFYDQRGSLRSPAPDASITYDGFTEDLESLRAELGVERLNLVAHSMGAVVASAYAAKYPDRLQRLVLVAPAYLKNPMPEEDKALRHKGFEAAQAFAARPEVQRELERYGLERSDRPLTSREETARYRIDLARRMLFDVTKWRHLTGGRATFNRRIGGVIEPTYPPDGWDFLAHFSRGGYPVTILVGDHDLVDFGTPLLSKWTAGLANVQLAVIENAGHLIWIDQPRAFTRGLRNALTERPKRRVD
jgi:pimeloyl-ACP methyl ester carboxylesterase